MTTYYDREVETNLDGSPIFRSSEDERVESEVADLLQAAWGVEIRPFGKLSPIDWFALRNNRMVGVLELKNRAHARETYATVFLNVRKWLALRLASTGLCVPDIFVVQFIDEVCWLPVADIDASQVRMGGAGRARAMRTRSEYEPVIEVPCAQMKTLAEKAA